MLVYYQYTLIKSMKVITEFSLQISEKEHYGKKCDFTLMYF